MATIYEVAARAGVSPATVSRVLNGMPVTPSYAERVRAAARELDFTPNRTARSLRRRSSEVIALVIPDIENPFFTAMARAVEDRAQRAGYSVVLCNTDEQQTKEARYLKVALSEHMAGVILAPAGTEPDLDRLVAKGTPVVAVDRSAHGYDVDTVVMDNVAIGRQATERLYAAGHSLVACITGPAPVETARERAAGWGAVFRVHHPDLEPPTYLRHSNYRVDGGYDAMKDLMALADPPDAVFVTNNLMGVGAMEALDGEDVSVLVLGDLPYGVHPRPGTSVLSLPARELGVTAADLLLQRIGGGLAASHHVVLGTH